MNHQELVRAVDDLATRDPERLGYGYADSQHPWHHDPAIDHGRTAFGQFLEVLARTAAGGTVVQIGLGRRPGRHLALRLCADRVVTVESDPGRLAALRAAGATDPVRDVLFGGDPDDGAIVEAVRRAAARCDLLLLDAGGTYEDLRGLWSRYAAMVREGGGVAIVDRSQAFPSDRRVFDVDRFVFDLERDFLAPRGVRVQRLGEAEGVAVYEQTAATRGETAPPDLPAGFAGTRRPRRVGQVQGFSLHEWQGATFAVPGEGVPFCARRLERNDYAVVLVGDGHAAAERLVVAWCTVEPALAQARSLLVAGDDAAAAAIVRSTTAAHPWLRSALIGCLEQAPSSRRLLLAQGTLALFDGHAREGVLLLRRALGLEMVDAELMRTVAAAYLRVLHDEAGARELLAEGRQRVRARWVAQVCRAMPSDHVLWHYPQLLASVRGVVEVGAHRGERLAAWTELEIPQQLCIEANPEAFADLASACGRGPHGRATAVQCALGARSGTARLRHGVNTARASLLALHPLAGGGAAGQQTRAVEVQVQTLDELVAARGIDPTCYDLLFVDTEGTELDVLRGATALLRHVELVCVGVFLQPVYAGAPMPQEIQAFLRDVNGGDGFGLRAFEPGDDPARGSAVFRRLKVPRRRR